MVELICTTVTPSVLVKSATVPPKMGTIYKSWKAHCESAEENWVWIVYVLSGQTMSVYVKPAEGDGNVGTFIGTY